MRGRLQFLSFFCILSSLMYVRGFCTACFCSCMFSQTQITDKIRENQARKQGVRIKKEKDPIRMLERPKEQMTVYRSDGTYITLETENGQVIIKDSTEKNSYRIVDADYFIHHIVRG